MVLLFAAMLCRLILGGISIEYCAPESGLMCFGDVAKDADECCSQVFYRDGKIADDDTDACTIAGPGGDRVVGMDCIRLGAESR